MTNDLKLKIYPAVVAILGLCLIASLFANVEIQVERNSSTDRRRPSEPDESPIASPIPTPAPTPIPSPTASATPVSPAVLANAQGSLRVSNQTEYPLRVALLQTVEASAAQTEADQPVHWDFAPGEGSNRGLILSLPNQNLQLQSGDVLVAFAQDGSRRYWGPYIVGRSPFPLWNADANEWQLTLQP